MTNSVDQISGANERIHNARHQSARELFFDYNHSGYLNKMFHSPNENFIAQTFCCGHN